jgi:hypothetical protein
MDKRYIPALMSAVLGFLSVMYTACTPGQSIVVSPSSLTPKNQPVIVSAADAFTFTVDALNFSYTTTQPLSFSGDSLVATLVVTNYVSGTGRIESETSDGTQFYSEVLTGNRTAVLAALPPSVPNSVSITLTRYTGTVSFVLARKK